MSVDIGQAIEEGGRRTLARNGLYLVVITWVLGIVNGVLGVSAAQSALQQAPGQSPPGGMPFGPGGAPMGPSLGLSPTVASLLSFVVGLISLVVAAAAVRTFVTDDTESLSSGRFTRNVLLLLVNLFVGFIVFAIVVGIGFVLLIIPGFFLLVSLWFWATVVAVEDENFVAGFSRSWSLTSGNRIMLFVLGVVVVIVGWIVSFVFGIPRAVGLTGWIGLILAQLGSAFASVFMLAITARTYVQLEADDEVAGAD